MARPSSRSNEDSTAADVCTSDFSTASMSTSGGTEISVDSERVVMVAGTGDIGGVLEQQGGV